MCEGGAGREHIVAEDIEACSERVVDTIIVKKPDNKNKNYKDCRPYKFHKIFIFIYLSWLSHQ